jgi:hypothetical protein
MSEQRQSTGPRRLRSGLLAGAVVAAIGGLLVWGFIAGRNDAATEAEHERPVEAPLRVSTHNGLPVITLDAETQKRSGIESTVLKAAPYQNQVRAYGMVLDVARLTELSNDYANAKARLQTAQAKVAASKAAFARARDLYQHGQTVSEAQFQTAEAAFHTDEAGVASAQAQVRTLVATADQEWGPVLGQALLDSSLLVTRLIERQDFLLQVTLPPGVSLPKPPPAAAIETGKSTRAQITFVSPATRTDPKIQGVSFFYIVSADSGVLPGMNVLAFLPAGVTVEGVVVPSSSTVWFQGRAWVYRRTDGDTFVRTAISTELPTPDGGYVVNNLPQNVAIVTRGAQLLLSEEFRAQIQVEED